MGGSAELTMGGGVTARNLGIVFDVERERRVEHGSERGACRMPTLAYPSVPLFRAHPPIRRSV
jgi:hypothetical protein